MVDLSAYRNRHQEVVVYPVRDLVSAHERATLLEIARRIAGLIGCPAAGVREQHIDDRIPRYLVPSDTVVGLDFARSLGIASERDFLGGVVPHAFVATKAITHPMEGAARSAPAGWSVEFGKRVRAVVLEGACVFTMDDARKAGERLLKTGPVRVKPVLATAGRGQLRVGSLAELDAALAAQDAQEVGRVGLVLEAHLEDVTTHSVGQVKVAGIVASYYGIQRLTPDRDGVQVYGGSALTVVRGGFDELLRLGLSDDACRAVVHARTYDAAATACFRGLIASRRNYDIAQGRDGQGHMRTGVLEQSWRIGGATSAEVVALQAFHADAALRVVRASSVELHGSQHATPCDAEIFFRGVDEKLGYITKFARVEAYGNP